MSEPRLPHDLRIGRFLLDDILRAFGFSHWFLSDITHRSQMAMPLITEMIAHLHTAGLVDSTTPRDCNIYYEQTPLITRENLRPPLTQNEVKIHIAKVLARAEELNREPATKYFFKNIYLFGSCLRGAEKPNDIDLAVEILRDGKPVSYEKSWVFGPPTEFAQAAIPLSLRKPGIITLHNINEIRSIGAPHKLVWQAGKGRVENTPIITPIATSPGANDYAFKLSKRAERQKEFEAIARHIATLSEWPAMPAIDVDSAPDITRDEYEKLQTIPLLIALAHLHCLPSGSLRDQLQRHLADCRTKESEKNIKTSVWAHAEKQVSAYIKASIRYNPWQLRPSGRLIKTTTPSKTSRGRKNKN